MLKPKLTALKKELAKMLAALPPPGQGAAWLALWRFTDIVNIVQDALALGGACAGTIATQYVVEKEAERLGIAAVPAVVTALAELHEAIDMATSPPDGSTWEERALLEDAAREASCKAARVILDAWGVPSGLMGPHPPGGRPPRERTVMPAWFAELVADTPEGGPE